MSLITWIRDRIYTLSAPPLSDESTEFIRQVQSRQDEQARKMAELWVEMMAREEEENR